MIAGSKPLSFDWRADGWRVLRGALVTSGGAGLTYLTTALAGYDFGMWTPVVMLGWSAAVDFLRVTFSNTERRR